MLQTFIFNDNKHMIKEVIKQKYRRYDSITIQISEVVWYYVDRVSKTRFIYEEIRNTDDFVVYCHYVSKENIMKNYPWFFEN